MWPATVDWDLGCVRRPVISAWLMQDFDAFFAAVVVYCHSSMSVEARLLFRAQDHNMTNGDFTWFTFRSMRSALTDRPWVWYGRYVDDPDQLLRRRRAFHVVKQVLYLFSTGWPKWESSRELFWIDLRFPVWILSPLNYLLNS